jgi:hypothetical protein
MVVPAMAQDNFPDVPDNHWAYEALARMKANGLLVGYPDGLFRGGRPASRYEMAVAIHATYVNLKNITDGLASQIEALKGGGNTGDLDNLRRALEALQNEVAGLRGLRGDVDNLRRLADTFQRELQDLNVNVEQMKRDLGDLADRVSRLEARRPAIDISGDANLWVGAGMSGDRRQPGLTKDARLVGVTENRARLLDGGLTDLTRDLTILHEGALTFATTRETGPKFRGTLVIGNMLGGSSNFSSAGFANTPGATAFGDQSRIYAGLGYTEADADIYLQDFGVRFDTSIAGLGFNAEVGRVGYKINPYIYQRIDNTSYFSNERWDNGKWSFDGAILGFNFGGAKLDLFGGRTSRRTSINGFEIQPMFAGAYQGEFSGVGNQFGPDPRPGANPQGLAIANETGFRVDRNLGANLNIPLTSAGNVSLSYLLLDSDTGYNLGVGPAGENNRISVFGANGDLSFGRVRVDAGFNQSNLQLNDRNRNSTDNTAWYAKLGFNGEAFGLYGQYREIEAKYIAPGDWGRLGVLRNPTNIRGFQVGGYINLGSALTVRAMGEFDEGLDNGFATTTSFGRNTDITHFNVGLDYKMSSNMNVMLGFEDTRFKNAINTNGAQRPGEARYQWATVGLGYGLSDAAKLSIAYEYSNVRDYFVPVSYGTFGNGGFYRGGFLTTQLTVKF